MRGMARLTVAAWLAAGIFSPAGAALLCHPLAVPGGPYRAECAGGLTAIDIDGSGSLSCPGDAITYAWRTDCPGGVLAVPTDAKTTLLLQSPPPCPVACTVTLRITNSINQSDEDSAPVTVEDTLPPVVTPRVGPLACLWPPDHRYVCFRAQDIAVDVADACTTASVLLTGCVSSEPDDLPGERDGHSTGDCLIAPDGLSLCARAERDQNGVGRNYRVSAVATDACGNTGAPEIVGRIHVPRRPSTACSAASSR